MLLSEGCTSISISILPSKPKFFSTPLQVANPTQEWISTPTSPDMFSSLCRGIAGALERSPAARQLLNEPPANARAQAQQGRVDAVLWPELSGEDRGCKCSNERMNL